MRKNRSNRIKKMIKSLKAILKDLQRMVARLERENSHRTRKSPTRLRLLCLPTSR